MNDTLFDYLWGADQCRSYACKYCGKPEPWYYLETMTPGGEANPTKRFLQTRSVGACMAAKRLYVHEGAALGIRGMWIHMFRQAEGRNLLPFEDDIEVGSPEPPIEATEANKYKACGTKSYTTSNNQRHHVSKEK